LSIKKGGAGLWTTVFPYISANTDNANTTGIANALHETLRKPRLKKAKTVTADTHNTEKKGLTKKELSSNNSPSLAGILSCNRTVVSKLSDEKYPSRTALLTKKKAINKKSPIPKQTINGRY
jgi:hypothetical protein